MVIATGHPNGIVQDAIMKCSTKIIPIDDPVINDFITANKAYEHVVIPGGMYPGMPYDTRTFGVKAVLLATTDTSDDVVYKLTKAVFDNLDSFKKLHPVFFGLNKDDMAKEAQSIAIHPGAAKYYKEIGLSFE
jgi:TRAP transporter TAXI family solute receptor